MDITAVIYPLLTQFWFLLPLLLMITMIKTPWFKGMLGEWFINLSIRLFLDKQEYHLLKDVTLPITQGTTQIDHVIISRFGIFVIETKNMKGWIFGNPAHKTWTQQIYRRKHHFQNPLHQNHLHMMTLRSLLGLADHQLHSVIYFIGNCTFKTPMPDNVMQSGLIRWIRARQTVLLEEQAVNDILATLEKCRLAPTKATHRAHVAALKARHSLPVEAGAACPRCGRPMVLRTAHRGAGQGAQFWGCSGYPVCRHTRSLKH